MVKSTGNSPRRRSPGEGSVYEAADGRWRGAATWTDPDGTRRRRVVSGGTSADARDKLDRLRDRLRLGTLGTADRRLTVAEYLGGWLERYRSRVRPATWRGTEQYVRVYLIPALGARQLDRLTAADVERALASFLRDGRPGAPDDPRLPRPISPMTARHIRSVLRHALGDAQRTGLIGRNAAADAAPTYVPHRPVSYLTADQVRRLLEATRDGPLGPIIAVAATTGLRLGELLGLGWEDLAGGALRVRRSMALNAAGGFSLSDPKSARSRRTIPLPTIAREALERRRAAQERDQATAGTAWQDRAGLVFTDAVGRPLRPDYISHRFRAVITEKGLSATPFHDLRHSAATMMLAEGVPLAVISEWLGHAGIAITASHYAAVVPALRHEAAAAMDRALAPRTGDPR